MPRNEAPEWFQILVIAIIAAVLFPVVFIDLINSIILAIGIGIVIAIVIIGVWWYLENRDSGGI